MTYMYLMLGVPIFYIAWSYYREGKWKVALAFLLCWLVGLAQLSFGCFK